MTLFVTGVKRIENRSWPTNYRGEIAIHAGKSWRWMHGVPALVATGCFKDEPMPFGAVLGTVELVDCVPNTHASVANAAFVDRTPGGFCWVLANHRNLSSPIECNGALSFWDLPSSIGSL